jgi:FMN phosphatase YigB (HAD superfamily)
MINNTDKVILTDVDGVLLNWEYAFKIWMEQRGFTLDTGNLNYDISDRYGLPAGEGYSLVQIFNESAAIGFLPPLRDAMYYVDLLHRKHGYVFRAITSLSTDVSAGKLRTENLHKLFGDTVFEDILCIGTGADKDEALEPYRDSGLLWIEDKIENAELGQRLGLQSILVEHGHNMNYVNADIPIVKGWKEIYESVR